MSRPMLVMAIVATLATSANAEDTRRATEQASRTPSRPATWAEPVKLDGVPNLWRITPTLYRSEQPTALGMKNLEKLGIRTVISLRAFHSDAADVKGTSLRTEHVRIFTWDIDDADVVTVMRLLRHPENGPFLIHCQHGADRTGVMSAMYRVLEQGWSRDDALAELEDGGYGYHTLWRNILRYVRSADVAKLRTAIGSDSTSDGANER